MRTTLTLDPDVAARLQLEIRRSGKSLKMVVNEALRQGLGVKGARVAPPPFKVIPHAFGVRAGIDLDRMNQLVDELEASEVAAKLDR